MKASELDKRFDDGEDITSELDLNALLARTVTDLAALVAGLR